MSTEWFVERQGGVQGPYTGDKLKALAQRGEVTPDDFIRQGTDGRSVPASKVKGLFAALDPSNSSSVPSAILQATSLSHQWYYAKSRTQHGPVAENDLRQLADSGHLLRTDLVWREGLADWQPAERVERLFSLPVGQVMPPPLPRPHAPAPDEPPKTEIIGSQSPVAQRPKDATSTIGGSGVARLLPPAALARLSTKWGAIGLTVGIIFLCVLLDNTHLLYAVIFSSAFFIYWDATSNKIGKVQPRRAFTLNMSAGMWAFMAMIMWVFYFPAYLVKRSELVAKAHNNPVEPARRGLKLSLLGAFASLVLLRTVAGESQAYRDGHESGKHFRAEVQRLNSDMAQVVLTSQGIKGHIQSIQAAGLDRAANNDDWVKGYEDGALGK